MIRLAIAIAIATRLAHADAAPGQARVVLADPDPELLRAITSALAPWRLEVIVDDKPPADTLDAEARAEARTARFVVWRRGGALVVFDRERGFADERTGAIGPLDPVAAASAALTVKTLMRLPPPPPPDDRAPPSIVAVLPTASAGPELRAQLMLATRMATGEDPAVGARFVAAVLVRPWSTHGWRFGVAADAGTPVDVKRASFKGAWTDWAVLALAGWTYGATRWELEPQLGAGFTRSALDGKKVELISNEHTTLATLRAGVAVRWRLGRWTLGGSAGSDFLLGTPTYTREGTSARIFAVPAHTFALGVLAAVDLGGAAR